MISFSHMVEILKNNSDVSEEGRRILRAALMLKKPFSCFPSHLVRQLPDIFKEAQKRSEVCVISPADFTAIVDPRAAAMLAEEKANHPGCEIVAVMNVYPDSQFERLPNRREVKLGRGTEIKTKRRKGN
jgi:hypothetical protein